MKNKSTGFTLLEVLMALIVISVGLVALVQSSQHSAFVLEEAKSKTAAYHVADQVMLKMYQVSGLSLGTHQGQQQFNGVTYFWQVNLSSTDNEGINRMEVVVSMDRKFDYAEAHLTGFKKS